MALDYFRKMLKERPLNRGNVMGHYIPLAGTISYGGLGVSVIQPSLIRRLSPTNDLTNFFLASSIGSTFLYVYNRKHMNRVNSGDRWKLSLFASTMFNLGSLLLWAIVRSGTTDVDAPQFKFFIAITTAYGLHLLGIKYLEAIDSQIK